MNHIDSDSESENDMEKFVKEFKASNEEAGLASTDGQTRRGTCKKSNALLV